MPFVVFANTRLLLTIVPVSCAPMPMVLPLTVLPSTVAPKDAWMP